MGPSLDDVLDYWEPHPDEPADDLCVGCWSLGPEAWDACPGPEHDR
jgi:hypothetical protein